MTGKPELMKAMNISLLYQAMIELGTATRAEIVEKTNISATTIRSILDELLKRGDLIELTLDASSGGRRAQRYTLNTNRNLIICLYFEGTQIIYQITGLTGEILENDSVEILKGDTYSAILLFLIEIQKKWDISAVGLGVPGIVDKGRYYYIGGDFNQWSSNTIGEKLEQDLSLPIVLENDLNCIALGFALRYAKANMAYIHINYGCSGAGIIADGKVIHGAGQFAGEVGFLPMLSGQTLDQTLQEKGIDSSDVLAKAVACISCITNPSLIVFGGERFESGEIDIEALRTRAKLYIPIIQQPKITTCVSYREDYLSGLSYLTTGKLLPKLPLKSEDFI